MQSKQIGVNGLQEERTKASVHENAHGHVRALGCLGMGLCGRSDVASEAKSQVRKCNMIFCPQLAASKSFHGIVLVLLYECSPAPVHN